MRWQGGFHSAYKVNADLHGRSGTIRNVDVMFYNADQKATLQALAELGAVVLQCYASQPDGAFYDAIVQLDAAAVDAVAAIPEVLWLGFESQRPTLDDEMSDQIVAGNHPGGTPVIGYNAHLGTLGVNGAGVTWAVIDTGVDYQHPDLGSHIVGGFRFPASLPAATRVPSRAATATTAATAPTSPHHRRRRHRRLTDAAVSLRSSDGALSTTSFAH